jgi:hypothetical protein
MFRLADATILYTTEYVLLGCMDQNIFLNNLLYVIASHLDLWDRDLGWNVLNIFSFHMCQHDWVSSFLFYNNNVW